ncbi:MAG: S8 family peptidase [Lewinellaceae bacterium]|nr:S8 family peptidase [Saprospiraceae bacterium]MCB9339096.1 S8 family peptidase [Lewinellaceae bacterium]
MKRFAFFLLAWALAGSLFSQTSLASQQQDELVVQLLPGTNPHTVVRALNAQLSDGGQLLLVKFLSRRFNIYLMKTAHVKQEQFPLDELRSIPSVIMALWNEPLVFRQDSIPNDPFFPAQWNMQRIQAPAVWSTASGGTTLDGREIVVAILDHGFDLNHSDLKDNIWTNAHETPGNLLDDDGSGQPDDIHGWNFENGSPFFPLNEHHGTNVAGIVGAAGNNGEGIAGINWKVKILPIGVRKPSEVLEGLEYILTLRELYNSTHGEKGAFIVATNTSFGLDPIVPCTDAPAWNQFYDALGQAGVISAAATANDKIDVDAIGDTPTSCASDFLITVTNTDIDDNKVEKSGYGLTTIDLGAPGYPITTTDILSRYDDGHMGTSFSSPHVAGAIALLYSLPCIVFDSLSESNPAESARLVKNAILKGVDPLPGLRGKTVTGGRLNVYNSMKYLHNYCLSDDQARANGSYEGKYVEERGFVGIYPNPARDALTIEYSNYDFTNIQVRIVNALGQETWHSELNTVPFQPQRIAVNVADWPAGTYIVNLIDNGRKLSRKFVKI